MSSKVKIALVDDHQMFKDGLRFVLGQVPDFEICYEASSGKEFLDLLDVSKPDIVLMDISMPEMDGIQATEMAIQKHSDLKIIALSSYTDDVYYYKMIKAGIQGFVLKKSGKEELEQAVKNVLSGINHFPQNMLRNIIFKIGNEGEDAINEKNVSITKREKEVLHLICRGYSNSEIANKLSISPKTVDNHRTNLLSKTNTKNSAHLVMYAIKNRFVEI